MNKRVLLIANPAAGRGAALRALPRIKSLLSEHGISFDLRQTSFMGQGIEFARQAAERGYEIVTAVGGDGTLNEVINGLMDARLEGCQVPALAVLPAGRGNDFAYSMGLPLDLPAACLALVRGHRRLIDIGRLSGGSDPLGRFFGNGIGVGFDALVSIEAARMTALSGFTNYLVALLKSLVVHFHSPLMQVEWEGSTSTTNWRLSRERISPSPWAGRLPDSAVIVTRRARPVCSAG
jgi:diacylglycerol kinase family enzyme